MSKRLTIQDLLEYINDKKDMEVWVEGIDYLDDFTIDIYPAYSMRIEKLGNKEVLVVSNLRNEK